MYHIYKDNVYAAYICCNIYYMPGPEDLHSSANLKASRPARGVSGADVERAADALLRRGERPTVERLRAALGTGSPNTINPLLDAWWQRIGQRLDAGPAALHRLPEAVAQVAEALWMRALEEGRRRAALESKLMGRSIERERDELEVRSHVLSLREGELDARLRDRERLLEALELRVRELTMALRKEQASRERARRQEATPRARSSRPAGSPQSRQRTGRKAIARKNSAAPVATARKKRSRSALRR
jgi:hypothetical protein